MSARDALDAIKARLEHEPCCVCVGRAKYENCSDCYDTGCAHDPYAEGEALSDLAAMHAALEAVLALRDDLRRAYPDPAPYTTEATVLDRLAAVEAALQAKEDRS